MKRIALLLAVCSGLILAAACAGNLPFLATAPQPAKPVGAVSLPPQGTAGSPWWSDTVFYEAFVRSFYDSNGDGIGDIRGLIQKLDYLNDGNPNTTTDLGVTGLWLMPIQPAASYHGYDITHYDQVNPQYGSLDDFKLLLKEAHRRGIRVVIDLVLNHTSDQNPWFVQAQNPSSSYHDWYVWGSSAHSGDPSWHKAPNGEYYYGFFGAGMPDLNYRNPAVTAKMEDVARFWLQDVGVDGFRLDAARYLIESGAAAADTSATHAWLAQFYTFYKKLNPQAMTVGEVATYTSTVATYTPGAQMDLAFDFDLADATVKSARLGGAEDVMDLLKRDTGWFPSGQYASFLTNHDQDRFMSLARNDPQKGKVAAALLLTNPGVPFIYYGEEIGMLGMKPDESIRSPMEWSGGPNAGFTTGTPWEAVNPDYPTKNVAAESADPGSLLSYYRELIRIRGEHEALREGSWIGLAASSPAVAAYLRAAPAETALVICNLGKDPVSGLSLSLAKSGLSGRHALLPILGAEKLPELEFNPSGGFAGYQPVPELPAYTTLIYQLQ